MPGTLLIVTNRTDATAHLGAAVLRRSGHTPVMLYPDEIPTEATVTYHGDQASWSATIETRDGSIDLTDVRSVWWRRPRRSRMNPDLPRHYQDYGLRETQYALTGLWKLLREDPGVYWMSHPDAIRAADNKLLQRRRAAEVGLVSPRTLISNDPAEVRAFVANNPRGTVFKTMTSIIPEGVTVPAGSIPGVPLVRPLSQDDLVNLPDVAHNLCEFQEVVEKAYELRVTAFEDELSVCRIDSQADDATRGDWRIMCNSRDIDVASMTSVGEIPSDVHDACVQLMKSFDLNFGAFDFIVTPEGRHVFLEVNPNGQWIFVQHWVPKLRLAQAFVDKITRNL